MSYRFPAHCLITHLKVSLNVNSLELGCVAIGDIEVPGSEEFVGKVDVLVGDLCVVFVVGRAKSEGRGREERGGREGEGGRRGEEGREREGGEGEGEGGGLREEVRNEIADYTVHTCRPSPRS